jgi:hypothetical protein
MTTDALRKMQEKLFRASGDATPRPQQQDEARESSALTGLTIDIPKPPPSPMPPPKLTGKQAESSPKRVEDLPSKPYRERLAQRLAGDYHGAEKYRLLQEEEKKQHWKKWGPYLSDRQWARYFHTYRAFFIHQL